MDDPPTEVFEDGEQYSGGYSSKQEVSFRSIVLNSVGVIQRASNCELRGGYWETRLVGQATQNFYVPDSREVYSNDVDFLCDLCLPHFDAEMRKAEEKVDEELNKARDEFLKNKEGKDRVAANQEFRTDKVVFKRKLFRHLSRFLYRKGYFDKQSIQE